MEPESAPQTYAANQGRPIRIGNDVLLVKALTGTEDGLALLETVAPPGGPAPLDHIHRSYDEVFYVLEGRFQFRIGDDLVDVDAGAVVSVPRGTAHTFKNIGTLYGRIVIVTAPGRAAQMLEDIGTLVESADSLTSDGLTRVYDQHDSVLVPPLRPH